MLSAARSSRRTSRTANIARKGARGRLRTTRKRRGRQQHAKRWDATPVLACTARPVLSVGKSLSRFLPRVGIAARNAVTRYTCSANLSAVNRNIPNLSASVLAAARSSFAQKPIPSIAPMSVSGRWSHRSHKPKGCPVKLQATLPRNASATTANARQTITAVRSAGKSTGQNTQVTA